MTKEIIAADNGRKRKMLPLNLQLFAQSPDETDPKDGEGQPDPDDKSDNGGNSLDLSKYSFDDLLGKGFQSEFDRRVTKALETAKQKWEQEQKDEADEAKKLEKMNETERERYQLNKDKSNFEKEKSEFALEKLKTAVGSELVKRGYLAEFAEFLTGSDAETSNANIDAFDKAFKKAIEDEVKNKMRGDKTPPQGREHEDNGVPPEDFHEFEKWRKQNS